MNVYWIRFKESNNDIGLYTTEDKYILAKNIKAIVEVYGDKLTHINLKEKKVEAIKETNND